MYLGAERHRYHNRKQPAESSIGHLSRPGWANAKNRGRSGRGDRRELVHLQGDCADRIATSFVALCTRFSKNSESRNRASTASVGSVLHTLNLAACHPPS